RFAYTQGAPSGNVPTLLRTLGAGKFHGIPYNTLVLLALAAVLAVLLHRSAFRRRIFIVGGNPVTRRLVGIRSDLLATAFYRNFLMPSGGRRLDLEWLRRARRQLGRSGLRARFDRRLRCRPGIVARRPWIDPRRADRGRHDRRHRQRGTAARRSDPGPAHYQG